MARPAVISSVFVGLLLMVSTAMACRPPTRGEEDLIRLGFQNAHRGDGVNLRSIREIRVSVVDDRWSAVVYSKPKRGSKKLARDYFRNKGDTWKKGKPPRAVAADLKKPAERYLVDIRYRGTGSFQFDYDGDLADAQAVGDRHLTADFNWDFEWRGVELYDDHYPGGDTTPDTATASGSYTYAFEDHSVTDAPYSCNAAGPLESAFEGTVRTDRGDQVAVTVESPSFAATASFADPRCREQDIWRAIDVTIPQGQHFPTLRGVPTFPTQTIEQPVLSENKCARDTDPGITNCALALTGTLTITPP